VSRRQAITREQGGEEGEHRNSAACDASLAAVSLIGSDSKEALICYVCGLCLRTLVNAAQPLQPDDSACCSK
jgi:hypothetical protein